MVMDVDQVTQARPDPATRRSGKLQRAKVIAEETEAQLGELCRDANDKIAELGIEIQRASEYHGVEWAFHVLGAAGWDWAQHKAASLRHERLQTVSTEAAVREIRDLVLGAIAKLGESEDLYEEDQRQYETTLTEVLGKQKDATPEYLAALEQRERLDKEVAAAAAALATVSITDRPTSERHHEALVRKLDNAKLDEATALAVLKSAQEAIPELQKNRDAATKAIQSLHGMRQAMLEKFADFKVILERATTAMKARAHVELYETMDPAFNGAITAITANNVATAGAALEVWTQRIREACVDPHRSQELLNELLQHVTDAATSLAETEAAVEAGPRSPDLLLKDRAEGRDLLADLSPPTRRMGSRESE